MIYIHVLNSALRAFAVRWMDFEPPYRGAVMRIRLNIVRHEAIQSASQRILKDVLANGPEATDLRGDEFYAAIHVPL